MEVIALVGPSGTGKSHRALWVARTRDADAIIDDGILIKDGRIAGGYSAKKEKNRIMAVRRAIFVLPGHAADVRQAIEETKPKRILILGTSDSMVQKIAKKLQLGPISEIIRIEDIASKQDIEDAQFHRLKEGKHIIPVPTIELKPHFSGYLIDPIQALFKKTPQQPSVRKLDARSIVRPIFSFYGKLIIDDLVVKNIVRRVLERADDIYEVKRVKVRHIIEDDDDKGITITIDLVLNYGVTIMPALDSWRRKILREVERMTGMVVQDINMLVKSLHVEESK